MNLTITIDDRVWPAVQAALERECGPKPQDVPAATWGSRIAAEIFKQALAEAMETAHEPPQPSRRIPPNRAGAMPRRKQARG